MYNMILIMMLCYFIHSNIGRGRCLRAHRSNGHRAQSNGLRAQSLQHGLESQRVASPPSIIIIVMVIIIIIIIVFIVIMVMIGGEGVGEGPDGSHQRRMSGQVSPSSS